jgi:DNA helicase IV
MTSEGARLPVPDLGLPSRGLSEGSPDEVEREREQAYITGLYGRLDALRERAARRLAGVMSQVGGTPAARTERESLAVGYRQQLGQLDAAENGLCFGRLDYAGGERSYIGRIGIHADNDSYDQLLMDWRADAARPFYLATAADPGDVRVRRHIKTRGRTVVRLDDEVLDLALADPTRHEGLTGEAALLAAVTASRTGRMRDIVETIQAEQDRIIRSPLGGVLVVQGGPGTGKTAVALHRAAYLLYTYRRQLEKRGVLVVGPNATFLRYIGQVLPSLGETSVLLATLGELMPGITVTGTERPEVARIKGSLAMVQVVARAVRDRQHVPRHGLAVRFDGADYRLSERSVAKARERARRSRLPHNQARRLFVGQVLTDLADVVARRLGEDPFAAELFGPEADGRSLLDAADRADVAADVRADPDVRRQVSALWPALTPEQLLTDLFASRRLLAAAAPSHPVADRDLLHRPRNAAWTPADVPLLDEAAELLGVDDRAARTRARRRRVEREAYAAGVLEIIGRGEADDPEVLMGADLLDAASLAERFDQQEVLSPAERAAADRTWAFGHVIVDEAQEMSPMAWRLLMRRCPTKSMTIVGDVAQVGDLAGSTSWAEALGPHVADRWRLAPLTVNYRTPAEIMAVAAGLLARIDPAAEPPRSVRESGVAPWRLRTDRAELAGTVARAAAATAEDKDGTLAVIVPAGRRAEIAAAVAAALPGAVTGDRDPDLEQPVVVLSVAQAKGLEFDSVLIAEPAEIVAESARGLGDLYVAMTRATQRLGVVHAAELPEELAQLSETVSERWSPGSARTGS